MLVTSIQTACSKCPPTAFCMPGAFCIAVLIWALRQVNSDRLHNVLHVRKCWSALACNVGTCQALHPIRDIPVDKNQMNLEDTRPFKLIPHNWLHSHFRYSSRRSW